MILSLKSFHKEKDIRDFFCEVADLESGFEVLSLLTAQGDIVLEAYITDENGRIDLPTTAFDGQSFRKPIRRLEKQWQKVLNKPTGKGSVHNLELAASIRRLIATHQARIDHANACIVRLTHLQQRAQKTGSSTRYQGSAAYYQALIDLYQSNITRLEEYQQKINLRINQLAK